VKIKTLQQQAYTIALARKQYDKPQTPKALLMRVVQELSEAANEIQKGKRMDEVYFEGNKPCGVPTEIADAVLVLLSISEHHQIDLERAIELKMEFNKGRV
jgi:NTP pyrophosphatase (non-canonical NTP hydrolase)